MWGACLVVTSTTDQTIGSEHMWSYEEYVRPTRNAVEWWDGSEVVHAVKLNAGLDVNGNGRTAWVGFASSGAIVATAVDVPNPPKWLPMGDRERGGWFAREFATTPAEYRDQVRRVEHKRGLFGVCRVVDGVPESEPLTRGFTRQRAQREARKYYAWAAPYTVVECGVAPYRVACGQEWSHGAHTYTREDGAVRMCGGNLSAPITAIDAVEVNA